MAAIFGSAVELPRHLVERYPELGRARYRIGGLPLRVGGWTLGASTVSGITLWRTIWVRSGAELEASTYLGGSEYEHVHNLAVDPAGNVHIVGSTTSHDFPIFNPPAGTAFSGGFLVKLAPSLSSFVYSTYFATGWDVAADTAGNTYALGRPNRRPGPPDACATKLDPTGSTHGPERMARRRIPRG